MSEVLVSASGLSQTQRSSLNPQQQAAVQAPLESGVKVLAGAGTGKTKLIAHRFVRLTQQLHQQGVTAPQNRILAVTFTDDAAQELQHRIQQEFLDTGDDIILDENAWIVTFHTCCYRILRQHGETLGFTQSPIILDSLQQAKLLTQLLQEIKQGRYADISGVLQKYQLQGGVPADILSLSSLQMLPIEGVADCLDRIPKVLQRIKAAGLSPHAFLQTATQQSQCLTETLKALPLREPYSGEAFESLEAYGHLWQRHFSDWAAEGWHPLAAALDLLEPKEADFKAALDFLAKPLNLFYYDRPQKRYLPNEVDFTKLETLTGLESQLAQVIAALYAVYQETLLTRNVCDFDGLINHTLTLLQTQPELRAHYQNHFEAIIVDEFQDSNGSQLQLLQLLMRTPANITVVGDEKQSIYGFRFAQRENLDLIFAGQTHHFIPLQTNYRSTPPILAVANRLTKTITTADQSLAAAPHHPVEEAPTVKWYTLGRPVEVTEPGSRKPAHEAIGLLKQREARLIATEIQQLVSEDRYRYGEIAVLAKSHQKLQQLQQILQELGIPAACRKNLTFFQEPVIRDVMALLRLVVNPLDDLALFRLLQAKLNQRQLKILAALRKQEDGKMPLSEAISQEVETTGGIEGLPSEVSRALGSLVHTLKAAHQRAESSHPIPLFQELAAALGISAQPSVLFRTFEKLLYALVEASPSHLSLAQLLETLLSYQQHPDQELPIPLETEQGSAVQLMTIHGSKGLEFPVVFVAYTEDTKPPRLDDSMLLFDPQYAGKAGFGLILGKFEGQSTLKKELYRTIWHTPRLQAEEKRLFYVALTRAKEKLYVLRAKQSADWTAAEAFQGPWLEALNEEESPL